MRLHVITPTNATTAEFTNKAQDANNHKRKYYSSSLLKHQKFRPISHVKTLSNHPPHFLFPISLPPNSLFHPYLALKNKTDIYAVFVLVVELDFLLFVVLVFIVVAVVVDSWTT